MQKLSRRNLLAVGVSAAALPLAGRFSPAFAADKLTIGFISPITGPLGGQAPQGHHVSHGDTLPRARPPARRHLSAARLPGPRADQLGSPG